MELNSLALEACVGDTSTYFGRIPRDIVRLIDPYITEPVRIDLIRYDDQDILSIYEDRILTYGNGFYCVHDIRGEIIAWWEKGSRYYSTLVSKEEIVICTAVNAYELYNFISKESCVLEALDIHPPNGSVLVRIYPYGRVYYRGKLYSGCGLKYTLLYQSCCSQIVKTGENTHARAIPNGVFSIMYKSSELIIFRKTDSCDFEFCGHKIEGVSRVHEALDGVIYVDSERKLKYMGRNGTSEELNYDRPIFPLHAFGTYMIASLKAEKVTAGTLYCFLRLRT